jgi:hypothetical protein
MGVDEAWDCVLRGDFGLPIFSGKTTMNESLNARRQTLLRELDRVNRQILETRKSMVQIETKIATLQSPQAKAA